jgi:hypothetical protein
LFYAPQIGAGLFKSRLVNIIFHGQILID